MQFYSVTKDGQAVLAVKLTGLGAPAIIDLSSFVSILARISLTGQRMIRPQTLRPRLALIRPAKVTVRLKVLLSPAFSGSCSLWGTARLWGIFSANSVFLQVQGYASGFSTTCQDFCQFRSQIRCCEGHCSRPPPCLYHVTPTPWTYMCEPANTMAQLCER